MIQPPRCPERPESALRFADGGALALGRVSRVMGILNVTPDSFADGGRHAGLESALRAAAGMAEAGADLVDVGGESTRPGAAEVDAEEETRRVVPVVEAIRRRVPVRVSIDTCKAEVARRALDAGADLVNDVTAFRDPAMLPLLAARGAPAIAMHMRGTPRTMQADTGYADLLGEIRFALGHALARARAAGCADGKILLDPGIGFGKSVVGNLEIVRGVGTLHALGCPVVIGASRKGFIGAVLDLPVEERLEGSLAVAALALWLGAHVVRVHDVRATVRVARVVDAVRSLGA